MEKRLDGELLTARKSIASTSLPAARRAAAVADNRDLLWVKECLRGRLDLERLALLAEAARQYMSSSCST
jgi:hypothetical protein